MDLLRSHAQLYVFFWLAIALLWSTGGYFLVHRYFNLKAEEDLITGFGVGLIAYLFLCNITGRFLDPILGFSLPGVIVFCIGYFTVRKKVPNPFEELRISQWILIIAGTSLVALFYLISRGISLFDEYKNLSIISQMGRGIIPPAYESIGVYGYHYGFHLLGASMMAIGGLFPWSAFDMSKAIVWGYTIILLVLIARRYLHTWWKSVIAGFIFILAGGTRYLLFLLPPSWMMHIDKLIDLTGTSAEMQGPLSTALHLPWTIDGGPPGSYLFAYMNGIYPNYVMSHVGTGTLSILILLLFWLLLQHERSNWTIPVYTIMFAFWALTWESSFGLFGLGMGLSGIYFLIFKRQMIKEYFLKIFVPGIVSLPVVIIQGGVITDRLGAGIMPGILGGQSQAAAVGNSLGFYLRSSPVIPSSHLGNISLDDPFLIIVAIAELGLVVLFLPWITKSLIERLKQGEVFSGIMLFSTWIGFLAPIFIGIESDRDITRFSAYAIGMWIILLSFDILAMKKWNLYRVFGILALAIMSIGGIENLVRELPAIATPVDTYYLKDEDVKITNAIWGKLPKSCMIFDSSGYRPVIITGCRTNVTYQNSYVILPQWLELRNDPTPAKLHAAGYDYVYFDLNDWMELPPSTLAQYKSNCVVLLQKVVSDTQSRRLFQINNCE